MQGTWCPKCRGLCPIQARERFEELVRSNGGVIIGLYKNTRTKVLIRCEKGHEFRISPATHPKVDGAEHADIMSLEENERFNSHFVRDSISTGEML